MIDTINLMLQEETQINTGYINEVKKRKGWNNLIPSDDTKYSFPINNYLNIGNRLSGIFINIQLPQVFHSDNRYILNQEEAYRSF